MKDVQDFQRLYRYLKRRKRKMPENKEKTFESDRILSYFQIEWRGLLAVTISGLIYNLGLIAGP